MADWKDTLPPRIHQKIYRQLHQAIIAHQHDTWLRRNETAHPDQDEPYIAPNYNRKRVHSKIVNLDGHTKRHNMETNQIESTESGGRMEETTCPSHHNKSEETISNAGKSHCTTQTKETYPKHQQSNYSEASTQPSRWRRRGFK